MNEKIRKPLIGDIAIAVDDTIHFIKNQKFVVLNVKHNVNSTLNSTFIQIRIGFHLYWFSFTYFKFQGREEKLKRILNERN